MKQKQPYTYRNFSEFFFWGDSLDKQICHFNKLSTQNAPVFPHIAKKSEFTTHFGPTSIKNPAAICTNLLLPEGSVRHFVLPLPRVSWHTHVRPPPSKPVQTPRAQLLLRISPKSPASRHFPQLFAPRPAVFSRESRKIRRRDGRGHTRPARDHSRHCRRTSQHT